MGECHVVELPFCRMPTPRMHYLSAANSQKLKKAATNCFILLHSNVQHQIDEGIIIFKLVGRRFFSSWRILRVGTFCKFHSASRSFCELAILRVGHSVGRLILHLGHYSTWHSASQGYWLHRPDSLGQLGSDTHANTPYISITTNNFITPIITDQVWNCHENNITCNY